MRFKITLSSVAPNPSIPINYQYPLSAAIYKILAKADAEYATFLHEKGYQVEDGLKSFKLFTFSDLKIKFKREGDRMHVRSNPELIVSFHLPEAAQRFISGLFKDREIDIADNKSKAGFLVEQIEALPKPDFGNDRFGTVEFDLASMAICGKKEGKGNYEFLSPEHRDWDALMLHNWKAKCKAAKLDLREGEESQMAIGPVFGPDKPRSRLIVIKAGTRAQTRIKGYYGFGILAQGPASALEVLYNAGCGIYTSLGCGCLEVSATE